MASNLKHDEYYLDENGKAEWEMDGNDLPFGLLLPEQRAVLEAHEADGGTILFFAADGAWLPKQKDHLGFIINKTYRTALKR